MLTDVSVWAGETMYSAHRLVLALSSHYFRLVVTGTSGEGKHPVIFLKVCQPPVIFLKVCQLPVIFLKVCKLPPSFVIFLKVCQLLPSFCHLPQGMSATIFGTLRHGM